MPKQSAVIAQINAAMKAAVDTAEPLPLVWVLQTYSGEAGFDTSLWGTEGEALESLKAWACQHHDYPADGAEDLQAIRDFFEWDGAPDVEIEAITLPIVLSETEEA